MLDWLQTIGIKMSIYKQKLANTTERNSCSCQKQNVGEHFIQTYEQKVLQARLEINQVTGNDTFAVLRLCGDQLFLYCNKGIQDVLFTDLQLRPVNAQQQTYNELITLDRLVNLNPDRLLFIICPDSPTRNYWLTLQYLDRWKELRAVKMDMSMFYLRILGLNTQLLL